MANRKIIGASYMPMRSAAKKNSNVRKLPPRKKASYPEKRVLEFRWMSDFRLRTPDPDPPGQEPNIPVKEPEDDPHTKPHAPIQEPGPQEPKRQ